MVIKSIIEKTTYKEKPQGMTSSILITRFDKQGRMVEKIDDPFEESWSYNAAGNITFYLSKGYYERKRYDHSNNMIYFENSNGLQWDKIYDLHNNPVRYKEKKDKRWLYRFLYGPATRDKIFGLQWEKAFDHKNREIYYADNDGLKYWKNYTEDGVVHYKDNKGFESWEKIDLYVNRISYRDTQGKDELNNIEYDNKGNIVKFSFRNGNFWEKHYDHNKNIVYERDVDGKQSFFEYNAEGNLISIKNEKFIWDYAYSQDKSRMTRSNNDGYIENQKFDQFGNLIFCENPYIIQTLTYEFY